MQQNIFDIYNFFIKYCFTCVEAVIPNQCHFFNGLEFLSIINVPWEIEEEIPIEGKTLNVLVSIFI